MTDGNENKVYRFCVSEEEKTQLQERGLIQSGEVKPKILEEFFKVLVNALCDEKGLKPIDWDIGRLSDGVGSIKKQITKKLDSGNLTQEQRDKLSAVLEML
jgi:hypothetical protein